MVSLIVRQVATFVSGYLALASNSRSNIYLKNWQITTGPSDKGLKLYDPGYLNTAPVRSAISYIDGDEGILRYRGYPIEDLAENSSFVEVAYLLSEITFYKNCKN